MERDVRSRPNGSHWMGERTAAVAPISVGVAAFRRPQRAKRVRGMEEEATVSSGVDGRSGSEATALGCLCPKERGREECGGPIRWENGGAKGGVRLETDRRPRGTQRGGVTAVVWDR
jgi:hypothetical protein